jgi:quercetin dioxygenase-like cupin family protein
MDRPPIVRKRKKRSKGFDQGAEFGRRDGLPQVPDLPAVRRPIKLLASSGRKCFVVHWPTGLTLGAHTDKRKPTKPLRRTVMADTTIKKVEAASSPRGEMGQKYLVAGKRVSMRLWIDEPGGKLKAPTARDYETVGYVISGSAKLDLEGQTLNLKAGDSWLVPAGAMHQYTIVEPFTAVEATAPPAEVHGRDTPA